MLHYEIFTERVMAEMDKDGGLRLVTHDWLLTRSLLSLCFCWRPLLKEVNPFLLRANPLYNNYRQTTIWRLLNVPVSFCSKYFAFS